MPITAARRRRIIEGRVGIVPHIPRRVVLSLHSLKRAATSSVGWTLMELVTKGRGFEYRVKMLG